MPKFQGSLPAKIVSGLLLFQGLALYSSVREEVVPASRPLAQMPRDMGSWKFLQDGVVDPETQAVLQADDILNRSYSNGRIMANFFVAGFRSQRTGKAPHSPKNCLPGSGWLPLDDRIIQVDVGKPLPIDVNRYVIAHGDERSLVLYWYQSRDRAVASEYKAKFWVVADAMRYNRTDTALVRVVVPIVNKNEAAAERDAEDLVKTFYSTLLGYLPA
jgi:EpsI family protein